MRRTLLSSAFVALLLCPGLASAQAPASKSAPLATELVKLLDSMKLDAVAGSRSVNEYVAAMYFPGSQLVVVNAKTTVPDRMKYLILEKSYKDLYVELNGAVDQASKTFISDLGANGLLFKSEKKNQPFDTVDAVGKTIPFDGDWRKAKISEQEYTKIYVAHDEAYSQMLQALIDTLKKPS